MWKLTAPQLGAAVGVVMAAVLVIWDRTRPPACTGAVFVELRPPLAEPGPYRFRLTLDDAPPCEFEVPLPTNKPVDTKRCQLALALETRVHGEASSIIGLTVGASPSRLRFEVQRQGESIYDAQLEPQYGPYATPREESKRFCGDRALVRPECRRGSSQCAPFHAGCDGPEDCKSPQVCCLNPELGLEYGAPAATRCSPRRACLDRFGVIACRQNSDCGQQLSCTEASLSKHYQEPVTGCR